VLYAADKIDVCLHLYYFRRFHFIGGAGGLSVDKRDLLKSLSCTSEVYSILESNELSFSAETKHM